MQIAFLLVALLTLQQVYCDLPVHCLKHQIIGQWKLQVGKVEMKGLGPLTCGHDVPDTLLTSYLAMSKEFKEERRIEVTLSKNAHVFKPNNLKNSIGRWTMVYDEGFELTVENIRFFAFSKYGPAKNGIGYDSYCEETLIGWYHNLDTHERGCYKATKVDSDGQPSQQAHNGHVVQPKLLELDDQPEQILTLDLQQSIVDDLNKQSKSWQAKIQPNWDGLTFTQINRRAGNKKEHQFQSLIEEGVQTDLDSEADSENDPYRNFSMEDISELPKEFSWKEKVGPVREQKDCGSCYTMSTMAMISSRLRIKGYDVELSPQQSIDCNYYNQGCDGGYPFLVEKFATEQYLVPESSYPYTGYTQNCQQNDALKKLDVFYGVKNYKFVGGYYGKSTERRIMQELRKNGPVVMNFEPEFDFMFYGGGIYHSVQAADWILNKQKRPEWEKVDHSVLCVGWGEENGQKYWLLQNSWGSQWGEDGYFRMRRGTDESAIESMAEAADPIVYKRKSKESFLQGQQTISHKVIS